MDDISEKYIELIKKEFEIQNETDALNADLPNVISEVHQIFQKYGVNQKILPSDVMFGQKFFGNRIIINWDIATKDRVFVSIPRLSEIIFDHYYPRPQTTSFYHFTSLDSAIKILDSKKFRLYNLIKNYDFDEFKTFYEDHNLDGYKKSYAPDGDLYEDHIMKRTFSLSLTEKSRVTASQESYMWNVFSNNHQGVKLEFDIKSQHVDFRDIYYKDFSTSLNDLLFNDLDQHFKNKYKRQFVLSKISKIGGFYLPSSYDIERETRFLVKEHTDDYDFNFSITQEDKDVAYIELPFSSNYANFDIKAIHLGKSCNIKIAEDSLNKLGLSSLIIYP
jgi:hypothetical protein